MNNLFEFVQALTLANDAVMGLPVQTESNDSRKQQLADVKEKARLQGLEVRNELRKLKNKAVN